jgi:L-rhamnonate dehydratase
MKIGRVRAHNLVNIPITPPPFRKLPDVQQALLVEIETDEGHVGWSMVNHGHGIASYAHATLAGLINTQLGPAIIGEDPLLTERISLRLQQQFNERLLGQAITSGVALIDIALWDVKGKILGQPVHHLLGGARDKVAVYITHGAAYGNAPIYSIDELTAEAAHLVKLGNRYLKNPVGRQASGPDPDDDYRRMKAVRDTVGPNVALAMDGNLRMSLSQATRLCKLTEELNIGFLEEPIHNNNPRLLAELRSKTSIPIAAAQTHRYTYKDFLIQGAVDIIQPNVNNDGGYTTGVKIAAMAKTFDAPIGHGNGGGPYNIALHAGVSNGSIVEYHFHKWMVWNVIFEDVPQPVDGYVTASPQPGLGLEPKAAVIKEYSLKA